MAERIEVSYLALEMCGADVATFRFTRPVGYEFTPGQYFGLALETADGRQSETFSHCSAPHDEYLELTTRLTGSPYKVALLRLQPGATAWVTGPGGRLRLPETADKVAFLVGGVGITPVRSILRDARQRGRVFADALLLFGNRDADCVPFEAEFLSMGDIGVRMVVCYEQPPIGWTGESGFITAEMVRGYLDPADGRPFVVAGPPVMVAAMERVLDDLTIVPERRLVERFGRSI